MAFHESQRGRYCDTLEYCTCYPLRVYEQHRVLVSRRHVIHHVTRLSCETLQTDYRRKNEALQRLLPSQLLVTQPVSHVVSRPATCELMCCCNRYERGH